MVDFPAQLTNEIDPQRVHLREANAHFLTSQPWEGVVRQIRVSQLRQHVA